MIARRIVRRYAAALFRTAEKAGIVDAVESDLGLVSHAFETSSQLWHAVRSPVVSPQKKIEALGDLFAGKVQKATLDYLRLLVEQHREEAILGTETEYVALANEARGVVEANVVTALPLLPDEASRLQAQLGRATGKQVKIAARIDPEIVGGVIVRIGDRVIDGSIRGSLAALREKLSE